MKRRPDNLSGFRNKFFEKKNVLEGILGKIDKKTCHVSQILANKGAELGEGLNPLKKEKLGLKSYK